ncbi:MAG: hypothetical protein V9E96_03655 [Chitinophagaceae bacterium]
MQLALSSRPAPGIGWLEEMRCFTLALVIAIAAGCSERRFAGVPAPDRERRAAARGHGPRGGERDRATASPDAGAPSAAGWIEAVRLERWADAAALIDTLPEGTRARADMRYVRGRAAVGARDGARAVALFDKLEGELPDLAADIERWRAEAQLLAGPYAPAAAYFARSTKARDLARAAVAYEKAGDLTAAKADRRSRGGGSLARQEHEGRGRGAPRARSGRRGAGRAAHGGGRLPLGHDARGRRGRASRAAGARSAEGRARSRGRERRRRAPAPPIAPARPVSRGEALHQQGMASYRARSYADAARTLREAAAAKSGHEAEDLHHAARALARLDRDEEAIKLHREVAQRWPRSPFAARSAYQAARLGLLTGRYKEAARDYGAYLSNHRRGEQREEAEYERALCLLSSGSSALARKALDALARKAPADKAARLRQLEGVAALRSGDRAGAVALWTEVSRSQPLTWAAQAARARLAGAGARGAAADHRSSGVRAGAGADIDLRLPRTPALLASPSASTATRRATWPPPSGRRRPRTWAARARRSAGCTACSAAASDAIAWRSTRSTGAG